jgi:tetratricopeptide (TPR) repeat protein
MKILKIALILLIAFTSFNTASAQAGSELLIKANRATLERRYSEAINLYNQYIGINPEDFRGYFNKGTTEYNAGLYNNAINSFNKTLSLNPIYKEAYYYRGQCNTQLKKYSLAISDYTHILAKDSFSVPFLKLRSEAYSLNKNNLLALNDLNVAISVDRMSGDLYKRRAELKVKMNDVDGAIKDYNAVEKLLPKYKMVHFLKGNLYLEIKETEFACEEFEAALDNEVVVAERKFNENCSQ